MTIRESRQPCFGDVNLHCTLQLVMWSLFKNRDERTNAPMHQCRHVLDTAKIDLPGGVNPMSKALIFLRHAQFLNQVIVLYSRLWKAAKGIKIRVIQIIIA